jgi:hypothetical protein
MRNRHHDESVHDHDRRLVQHYPTLYPFIASINAPIFLQPHSLFQPDTGDADTGISMGIDAGVSNIPLPPLNMYTTSFAFGDEPENGNPNSSVAPDDSMSSGLQAVYEDPSQAAERRKLISLLNGAPGQSRMRDERVHRAAVVARSNVATPSGRMAGF